MACVDGRVDDGSTGVSLRVRVVVDVLAAEDRVARLHVLQRTLPRRCVKDGGVDKLQAELFLTLHQFKFFFEECKAKV